MKIDVQEVVIAMSQETFTPRMGVQVVFDTIELQDMMDNNEYEQFAKELMQAISDAREKQNEC